MLTLHCQSVTLGHFAYRLHILHIGSPKGAVRSKRVRPSTIPGGNAAWVAIIYQSRVIVRVTANPASYFNNKSQVFFCRTTRKCTIPNQKKLVPRTIANSDALCKDIFNVKNLYRNHVSMSCPSFPCVMSI